MSKQEKRILALAGAFALTFGIVPNSGKAAVSQQNGLV